MGQDFEVVSGRMDKEERQLRWRRLGFEDSVQSKEMCWGKGCVNNSDDMDGRAQAIGAQGKMALLKQQESVEPD